MAEVKNKQSRKTSSPLAKTKSYYESTTNKVTGKRSGKHTRSTSRGHTEINDTILPFPSNGLKISLEQRLNNSNIIDLHPQRTNTKRTETEPLLSPRTRKRSQSAHTRTALSNTITTILPIEQPPHLQSHTDPPKRVYNPSEVIKKINEKLQQNGHRYSEREIEVMENQIVEERRELMRIFRQLSAQKEKHNKLKKEDLKIQDILSVEKCKQIQDLIPKQALQRIESDIFLATISGPNYNETVCSYRNCIAAISISTYPVLEGEGRAGDPICDFYYARLFSQGTIFALADGCNWGEAPKQAAQRAASCFVRYIQDRLYRLTDTKQVTKEILKAFAASHGAIMMDKENTEFFRVGTATLIGGALLPLQKKPVKEEEGNESGSGKSSQSSKKKTKTRKRRKTTEMKFLNVISPRSDPAINSHSHSPRRQRREKLINSSGSSAPSHQVNSERLQSNPLKPKLSPSDEKMEDLAPPRSKQKRCRPKLSPRKSPAVVSFHSDSETAKQEDNSLVIDASGVDAKEEEISADLDTPPAELRKLVPGPLVRVRDRKKEHSPLSQRKRSSARVDATNGIILEEPVMSSPGRHRSFTHYGYAGRNQIKKEDQPQLDLSRMQVQRTESHGTIDETTDWAFVIGSVGDCKVFLYNPTEARVTDITNANRSGSINAADCGGRLGPCDKQGRPDLRNLFVVSATVQENDLILLVSDGVHDNLDPELLGMKPHEVSPSVIDTNKTWDDIPFDLATSLKNRFREIKLGEMINGLPKKTPKNVCKCLATYCRNITEPSRTFMQNNPSLEMPDDYVAFPGKMDHTSCICIQVGSRNNHSDLKLVRDAFVRKEILSITH